MKLGFSGVLLAGAILSNAAATESVAQLPTASEQTEASLWLARIVDRYRYKSEGQPDGIGARPLDRFVEALDADHMVFTKLDLASMAGQRSELDKLVNEKQMEIPNAIFATYVTRSIALHAHALEVLAQPLNFNGHERFQRVRSKAGWEADEAALRDLWRRRVMDDYLNLRLAGKAEAGIVSTLRQRYDRNLQRVRAMRSEDVASLFLSAYVEYRDPHGAYLPPQKAPSSEAPVDAVGIGLVLQKNEDLATVREVLAGSPADRGAIGPGDRIVGVERVAGQPTTDVIGWRVDEVIALLRGVAGSQVALELLPQGVARGSAPRRVVLTRQGADRRAAGQGPYRADCAWRHRPPHRRHCRAHVLPGFRRAQSRDHGLQQRNARRGGRARTDEGATGRCGSARHAQQRRRLAHRGNRADGIIPARRPDRATGDGRTPGHSRADAGTDLRLGWTARNPDRPPIGRRD